ncbi:hypothetical protein N9U48_00255 [Bacteroidota bacterium]|nr:hypothetical protein [Bacteroidota bacterium]
MKKLYIILLILPLIGFGQGWEQILGGNFRDKGHSVQQTSDGGYIITGTMNEYGNEYTILSYGELFLIKTDENGNEQWSKTFGEGYGRSVQQTTDGGYIITGSNYIKNNNPLEISDVILIKTDENGNEEWSQTLGGTVTDEGHSVQQTLDGGYIIAGWTGIVEPDYDTGVYLIKTDENGEEEWSKSFGGGARGYSVQQTVDGGYIVAGSKGVNVNGYDNSDVYLLKTDGDGIEQWSQTFGTETGGEIGYSVQQTVDGGYIVTGSKHNPNNFDTGMYSPILIKIDESGEEEWFQTFGGDGWGYSVQQTVDGGYIVTGSKDPIGNDVSDVYLLKTDENGEEEWSQIFDGSYEDVGFSVQQTTDGGYIITGYTNYFITIEQFISYDIYLIKTDNLGNITSTLELPAPSSKRELVKTTNILGQENITIKNQPMIEIYDDGSVEKKYIIE